MITGELKNKVDSIWDTIWTGGITSPSNAVEQITYLLFIKLLDDEQIKKEANANALGVKLKDKLFKDGICTISEEPLIQTEYKNLRWSEFHDWKPEDMMTNMQQYVFPFIKQLGSESGTAFSKYMDNATFLIPTAKVLAKVVDGIDDMDMNNKDIMGDVYEYLLGKMAAAGNNGQFRTPRHIIKMVVEMMKPTLSDRVLDPAMGSAGFLLEAVRYVQENQGTELMNNEKKKYFKNEFISGFDTDPTMLRIGSMNMMLHDVSNPHIEYKDSLSKDNTERDMYTLIMANPPFKGSVFEEDISTDILSTCKSKKTELLFVSLFTHMLEIGGRCASVVPDGVLFGSSKAHVQLRSELVENNKLIAVVSMPSGVFKPYAGVSTAIIIFQKGGTTDKVWFYDMKADGYSLDDKRSPVLENDIPDVVARYNNLKAEAKRTRTDQSFFVDKDEIVNNGYDLSINKYEKVEYEKVEYPPTSQIIEEIIELNKQIDEETLELKKLLNL